MCQIPLYGPSYCGLLWPNNSQTQLLASLLLLLPDPSPLSPSNCLVAVLFLASPRNADVSSVPNFAKPKCSYMLHAVVLYQIQPPLPLCARPCLLLSALLQLASICDFITFCSKLRIVLAFSLSLSFSRVVLPFHCCSFIGKAASLLEQWAWLALSSLHSCLSNLTEH